MKTIRKFLYLVVKSQSKFQVIRKLVLLRKLPKVSVGNELKMTYVREKFSFWGIETDRKQEFLTVSSGYHDVCMRRDYLSAMKNNQY